MNKNYVDVTEEWLRESTPNSYKVEDQLYYEHGGVKYEVDGRKVVLDYSKKEREVAEWLENTFGGEIKMIPRVNYPEGIKTPDYIFRGIIFDLKEINGSSVRTIDDSVKSNREQATNFILELKNSENLSDMLNNIEKIYSSPQRSWINIVIVKSNNNVIKIYKRKRSIPQPKAR